MMLVRRLRGLVFGFLLVLDLAMVAAVPLLLAPLLVEVEVVVDCLDRFEGLVTDSIYWTSGRRCFDFSSGLARVVFLLAVLAVLAAAMVVDSHCCWVLVLVLVLADHRCCYWVLHLAPVPVLVDYCHCRYRYWCH
jgi:hypothetical protein